MVGSFHQYQVFGTRSLSRIRFGLIESLEPLGQEDESVASISSEAARINQSAPPQVAESGLLADEVDESVEYLASDDIWVPGGRNRQEVLVDGGELGTTTFVPSSKGNCGRSRRSSSSKVRA